MTRAAPRLSERGVDVYRAYVSAPGAATAMLNWYRAAGRDVMAGRDSTRQLIRQR